MYLSLAWWSVTGGLAKEQGHAKCPNFLPPREDILSTREKQMWHFERPPVLNCISHRYWTPGYPGPGFEVRQHFLVLVWDHISTHHCSLSAFELVRGMGRGGQDVSVGVRDARMVHTAAAGVLLHVVFWLIKIKNSRWWAVLQSWPVPAFSGL